MRWSRSGVYDCPPGRDVSWERNSAVLIIQLELRTWIRLWTHLLGTMRYVIPSTIIQHISASVATNFRYFRRFSVQVLLWPRNTASIQLSPSSRRVQPHVLPCVFNESRIIFQKYLQVRVSLTLVIKDSSHLQISLQAHHYRCQLRCSRTACFTQHLVLAARFGYGISASHHVHPALNPAHRRHVEMAKGWRSDRFICIYGCNVLQGSVKVPKDYLRHTQQVESLKNRDLHTLKIVPRDFTSSFRPQHCLDISII